MISEEDNCDVVTEVTEEEMNNAIKSIASIFAVVKLNIFLYILVYSHHFLYIYLDKGRL